MASINEINIGDKSNMHYYDPKENNTVSLIPKQLYPVHAKEVTTRVVDAGGTAGSPTAFGSFSSTDMTLKLRENDTGASRGFGTTTHAWIMFTLA